MLRSDFGYAEANQNLYELKIPHSLGDFLGPISFRVEEEAAGEDRRVGQLDHHQVLELLFSAWAVGL